MFSLLKIIKTCSEEQIALSDIKNSFKLSQILLKIDPNIEKYAKENFQIENSEDDFNSNYNGFLNVLSIIESYLDSKKSNITMKNELNLSNIKINELIDKEETPSDINLLEILLVICFISGRSTKNLDLIEKGNCDTSLFFEVIDKYVEADTFEPSDTVYSISVRSFKSIKSIKSSKTIESQITNLNNKKENIVIKDKVDLNNQIDYDFNIQNNLKEIQENKETSAESALKKKLKKLFGKKTENEIRDQNQFDSNNSISKKFFKPIPEINFTNDESNKVKFKDPFSEENMQILERDGVFEYIHKMAEQHKKHAIHLEEQTNLNEKLILLNQQYLQQIEILTLRNEDLTHDLLELEKTKKMLHKMEQHLFDLELNLEYKSQAILERDIYAEELNFKIMTLEKDILSFDDVKKSMNEQFDVKINILNNQIKTLDTGDVLKRQNETKQLKEELANAKKTIKNLTMTIDNFKKQNTINEKKNNIALQKLALQDEKIKSYSRMTLDYENEVANLKFKLISMSKQVSEDEEESVGLEECKSVKSKKSNKESPLQIRTNNSRKNSLNQSQNQNDLSIVSHRSLLHSSFLIKTKSPRNTSYISSESTPRKELSSKDLKTIRKSFIKSSTTPNESKVLFKQSKSKIEDNSPLHDLIVNDKEIDIIKEENENNYLTVKNILDKQENDEKKQSQYYLFDEIPLKDVLIEETKPVIVIEELKQLEFKIEMINEEKSMLSKKLEEAEKKIKKLIDTNYDNEKKITHLEKENLELIESLPKTSIISKGQLGELFSNEFINSTVNNDISKYIKEIIEKENKNVGSCQCQNKNKIALPKKDQGMEYNVLKVQLIEMESKVWKLEDELINKETEIQKLKLLLSNLPVIKSEGRPNIQIINNTNINNINQGVNEKSLISNLQEENAELKKKYLIIKALFVSNTDLVNKILNDKVNYFKYKTTSKEEVKNVEELIEIIDRGVDDFNCCTLNK